LEQGSRPAVRSNFNLESKLNRRSFLLAGAAMVLPWPRSGFPRPSCIGANTAIDGYGLFESIALLHKLGFAVIEIPPMGVPEPTPGRFPGFQFDRLSFPLKRRLRAALAPFQVVTAHLPYTGVHYFSKEDAEASVRTVQTALEGAAYFGAKIAILHPMPPSGYAQEEGWSMMVRRIREWGTWAGRHSMRLALETGGYPGSVHDFVRLVQEVDHPQVGATIDVGHQSRYAELVARVRPQDRGTPEAARAYNDTTHSIIDALGPKVFHFHVHDIDPQTWKEHQPIGTGFVDYPRLFRKLRQIRYGGVLVLEIGAPANDMPRLLADSKRRLEGFLSVA